MEIHGALPMMGRGRSSRYRKKVLFIFGVVALLGILGSLILYRPVTNRISSWRSASHLAEAEACAEAEQWEESIKQARKSLSLQHSIDAMRVLGRSLLAIRSPDSLSMARQLFRQPEATVEDRTWSFQVVIDNKDMRTASWMLPEIEKHKAEYLPLRTQLVRYYLISDKYAEALALVDDQSFPSDLLHDLILAHALVRKGIQGTEKEVNVRLNKVIGAEDSELALKGLDLLLALNPMMVEKELVESAIQRFQGDSNLKPLHRLSLSSLEVFLGQKERGVAIQEAISEFQELDRMALVVWLCKLREADEVLALTTGSEYEADESFFRFRLAALEMKQDWPAIEEALKAEDVSVKEPLRHALQFVLAKHKKDEVGSIIAWRKAMEAAETDGSEDWYLQFSKMAAREGYLDGEMESLFRAIVRGRGSSLKADNLSRLFSWLSSRDEEKRLLLLTEILLIREPENPQLLNNYLYLKALHKTVDQQDAEALAELVERFPKTQDIRLSLAFVQHRLGKHEDALVTLETGVDWDESKRSVSKAIRARSLYSLGQEEKARAIDAQVNWIELSKQEKEVLSLPFPPKPEKEEVEEEAGPTLEDGEPHLENEASTRTSFRTASQAC